MICARQRFGVAREAEKGGSVLALLALLYALNPQPLQAPTRFSAQAGAEIDEAMAWLDSMDYARVIERLYQAKGPYALRDLIRRDEILGTALALSDRESEAFEVFKHLLAIAPGFDLSYTLPPKVTVVFERARSAMAQRNATLVELQVEPEATIAEPVPLKVFCAHNSLDLIVTWELCFRQLGADLPYSCLRQPNTGEGSVSTFVLPALSPLAEGAESASLQLALSGFDAQGNEVYSEPGRIHPREVQIGVVQPQPWYAGSLTQKPWFWAIVGGGGLLLTTAAVASLWLIPGEQMTLSAELGP